MSRLRVFDLVEEDNEYYRRSVEERKRWRSEENFSKTMNSKELFPSRVSDNKDRNNLGRCRRRKKSDEFQGNTSGKDLLNDYLESTTIHGLKYFANTSVNVGTCGKILWLVVMITAFVCLSLMVKVFFDRYNENPTRTYVTSQSSPIFPIEFPAVTICPSSLHSWKHQQEALEKLRKPENMSQEEVRALIKYGSESVNPELSPSNVVKRDRLEELLRHNKLKLVEFVEMVSRPCEDFVESCYWMDKKINCSESFKRTLTYRGFCCAFNYHLEDFIKVRRKDKLKKFHATGYGPLSGLFLVLKKSLFLGEDGKRGSIEKIMANSIGVLIFIHQNMDYLGNEHPGYILQAGEEMHIRVEPKVTNRLSNVYRPGLVSEQSLQCLSSHDKKLEFFPEYRYSNCYASCRMRASLQLCGCIDYFYNIVENKTALPVCELKDFSCLNANSERLKIVSDVEWENFTCTCMDSCNSLQYFAKPTWCTITENRFVPSRVYQNLSEDNAVLRVFMISQDFSSWETSPAADEFYLLSSIGGIYGLFLGCSFLSIIEIIYYSILICRACIKKSRDN